MILISEQKSGNKIGKNEKHAWSQGCRFPPQKHGEKYVILVRTSFSLLKKCFSRRFKTRFHFMKWAQENYLQRQFSHRLAPPPHEAFITSILTPRPSQLGFLWACLQPGLTQQKCDFVYTYSRVQMGPINVHVLVL